MRISGAIKFLAWGMILALAGTLLAARAAPADPHAVILAVDGAIGPATDDYLTRGIERAAENGARLIIIEMDTPGGLDTSMRAIIRAILGAPIPVATYVTPSGARAASAGTFILYASHLAVMTPGTNLGAATPVAIGGGGFPGGGEEKEKEKASEGAATGATTPRSASEAKAINDAVAFIRSLADMRGRNADWAEAAVRQAESLSAAAAAERDVIDFVARDVTELLDKAHGRTVMVQDKPVTLETRGLRLERVEPDWRTRFLATITDPNIALILMMIGIYGLIFEFTNPGAFVPGTVGAISLLIGLYALAVLPIDYAGLGLILLGIALMVAEAFIPSFGILGVGGVIAFLLGATIMFDTDLPGFTLLWPVAAGVAAASLGFTLLILRMVLGSRRAKVATGREQMIGATAQVLDWQGGQGHVLAHGERWRARAVGDSALVAGDRVRINAIHDLTLDVERDLREQRQEG